MVHVDHLLWRGAVCVFVAQSPLILSLANHHWALPARSPHLPINHEALLALRALSASLVPGLDTHVPLHSCVLEGGICLTTHAWSLGTLTHVLRVALLLMNYLLHLILTHDTTSKNTIIWILTSAKNLCFVSLMDRLRWIIASNVHIRLR